LKYFYKGNKMKKIHALLDFTRYSGAEKVSFFRNIIDKLTDNPDFTTPDIPLDTAKAAVDTLESSMLNAKDGAHTAVSAMHANEAAADEIFRLLAVYVNRIAAGDETQILSSGFHLSNQPVRTPKPVLSVNDGEHSGSVTLVAKAVERAGAYIWQYAKDVVPETNSGWASGGVTTRATTELTGLAVASHYYFRVSAVTPDKTMDFSAPVAKIVV
jgi:hypothetical protein